MVSAKFFYFKHKLIEMCGDLDWLQLSKCCKDFNWFFIDNCCRNLCGLLVGLLIQPYCWGQKMQFV